MLGIGRHGIVQQHKDGTTTILRPGKNGGLGTEIAVPSELADTYRLATGEIVEGETEPLDSDGPCTERLTTLHRINGLTLEEAEDRPFPRSRRSHSERTPPDRWLPCATRPQDTTGRWLEIAAPLGIGDMGIVWGPHGSGLTYTLRTILQGLAHHAPDCVPILLLLRARGEEVTDWRRRFPQVDVVVCPATSETGSPEPTLRLCELVWEAAQRQTESGKDVVLLLDSLTGLWGSLLEAEGADAQTQADQSEARQRIREWVQKAGCFHGETPLGGSLGGSLTILGTAWHQPIDTEAEEEGEVHPHLRLLEYLLPETTWRVALSGLLAQQRLYPAIDLSQCLSRHEEHLLPAEVMEGLWGVRRSLPRSQPLECYAQVMEALEATEDLPALLHHLRPAPSLEAQKENDGQDFFLPLVTPLSDDLTSDAERH